MKVSENKLTSVKVSNSQKEQQTHEKSNRRTDAPGTRYRGTLAR